ARYRSALGAESGEGLGDVDLALPSIAIDADLSINGAAACLPIAESGSGARAYLPERMEWKP
ncbi:hypothetical protein IWW57_004771, partial [Coemansia sp. S610]